MAWLISLRWQWTNYVSVYKNKMVKPTTPTQTSVCSKLFCTSQLQGQKRHHIQPLLQSLQWLPITARIRCFNSFTDTAPTYLSECLNPYVRAGPLRSSTDSRILTAPRVSTKNLRPKICFFSSSSSSSSFASFRCPHQSLGRRQQFSRRSSGLP